MHLKSYEIDGKLLRTGAANFPASGLKRQDNDLIVIDTTDLTHLTRPIMIFEVLESGDKNARISIR
jgi:phosphatidylserine/phosphatidylglycerophosphate/cardiolipin synthase-like enzyme